MSAGIKTQSDTSESSPLPNSRRVYVNGNQRGVRVPFREISQNPSRNFDGTLTPNPPVRVYDTSGPWGDPDTGCSVSEGLPQMRREWILARADVEEYEGREAQPIDDGYLTFEAAKRARVKDIGKLEDFPAARRTVLARAAFATALVSSLSAARTVKLAGATEPVLAHLARLDGVRSERQRREIAIQVWARSTPSVASGLLPIAAWALYLGGHLSSAATLIAVATLGAARWFAWTAASLVSQLPSARVGSEERRVGTECDQ